MSAIHEIRKLYFDEGKTITQIREITGHDRKTIRTYLNKTDWNDGNETGKTAVLFPKLEPYKKEIDQWLENDKQAKKKQRHTAKRVFDRLSEQYGEAFTCSYRTVAGYFSLRKKELYSSNSGHIPLEHRPGEAQVDFGDAEFYENGKLYQGKYLNLSFPYSNKGYFQLFKGENQECLFEGLMQIFEYIRGVPTKIWFDNTGTIVKKILQNGERNLTDAFLRFMAHYRFDGVFCNPNAGHEKGNVEGKVGYHRRNMLVPVPRFENLAVFNQQMLEMCDADAQRAHYRKEGTIEELYREDSAVLLDLPAVCLDTSKYMTVKTNNYGRFYLNGGLHEYSVSPKYSNARVMIQITANEVIVLDENLREIVRHQRFYGNTKQQSMNWLPYLTQLSRRPGALKYSGIYNLMPESLQSYLDRCTKSNKGKILKIIAFLTEQSGFDTAVNTVDNALSYDTIDSDSLLNLHRRIHGQVIDLAPIQMPDNVPNLPHTATDLAAYDKKITAGGHV